MPLSNQTAFEREHFDPTKIGIQHSSEKDILLNHGIGCELSDEDVRELTGAPSGSTIIYKNVNSWPLGSTGKECPPPGLYFEINNGNLFKKPAVLGLCNYGRSGGMGVYLKALFLQESAPTGLATTMLKKIVRFCLINEIGRIDCLAAGGRLWGPSGKSPRFAGYYAWARMGFDMPLWPQDRPLLPHFPDYPTNLQTCKNVQDVLKRAGGLDWWKVCGTGSVMKFDCSSDTSSSVSTLDFYLKEKGL